MVKRFLNEYGQWVYEEAGSPPAMGQIPHARRTSTRRSAPQFQRSQITRDKPTLTQFAPTLAPPQTDQPTPPPESEKPPLSSYCQGLVDKHNHFINKGIDRGWTYLGEHSHTRALQYRHYYIQQGYRVESHMLSYDLCTCLNIPPSSYYVFVIPESEYCNWFLKNWENKHNFHLSDGWTYYGRGRKSDVGVIRSTIPGNQTLQVGVGAETSKCKYDTPEFIYDFYYKY